MAYLDGQILDKLDKVLITLTSTKDTHGVLTDVLIELQQLRIAVSEVLDVDLGAIDVQEYSPTSEQPA